MNVKIFTNFKLQLVKPRGTWLSRCRKGPCVTDHGHGHDALNNVGDEDKDFLGKLCAMRTQAALGRFLGRAPICPKACLNTGPKTASRD